jgi:diguanylate cyclase (GGDEF)-like protein/PAS domain S-box-containing protein
LASSAAPPSSAATQAYGQISEDRCGRLTEKSIMDSKPPYKRKVAFVVYSAILIGSIIAMLFGIRFSVMQGHEEIKEIVAINIGNMQSSFTKGAETVLKDSGQEIIRLKAEKVAKDIENYLIRNPHATIKDMQNDPQFKPIAIQPVGKTGYTAVHEANTDISRFHINPKIVNTALGALARALPDFWKIIIESRGGKKEAGGYYKWREADGSVREKYMWVATVSRPTAEGIILDVAATTYIDEFMQPLAQLSGKLVRESTAASAKAGSLSENILNKTLVAIMMIILIFCGVVGYMAFRLIRGYRRIELEVREREKVEAALRSSEYRLAQLIDFLPDATLAIDTDKRVTVWNRAMEHMTGVPSEEMIGRGDYEYTVPFYGERRPQLMDLFWEHDAEIKKKYSHVKKEGDNLTAEMFCTALYGGKGAHVFAKASPLRDPDGNIIGAIEALRDISDPRRMEEAIRESEEKYRSLVNNLNVGIYRSDVEQQGRFIQANPAVARIFGYSSVDEFMQVWVKDLYQDPGDRKKFMDAISQTGAVTGMELRLRRKDGEPFHASITARANCNETGDIRWIDGVIEDITDRKRLEEEIRTLAVTDQLTGLYNRRGFIALSEQQLKIAERTKSKLLLLFADLDGMKWINDNLGHLKGDEALIGVADILKQVFREADIVARVGGDEFAVLALGISVEYPEILKDRLQQQIDLYNSREKRDYQLSLSVGIVESDIQGTVSIDVLMSLADERMYENKKRKSHESASRPG